jgi:hypothetical protein
VSKALHELGERGAGCSGQRGSGVPQIAEAQVWPSSGLYRRVVHLACIMRAYF